MVLFHFLPPGLSQEYLGIEQHRTMSYCIDRWHGEDIPNVRRTLICVYRIYPPVSVVGEVPVIETNRLIVISIHCQRHCCCCCCCDCGGGENDDDGVPCWY